MTEDDLNRVPETALDQEATLENHLLKTDGAEIGSVEILYFSRQEMPSHGGFYDIGGVDREGNVVVVELKRGRAPRDVITQALDYVSGIRNEKYSDLNRLYHDFLRKHDSNAYPDGYPELAEAHEAFFGLDEPLSEREFNTDQRIVLVGTSFQDASLNMADFLRERGIDVVCVEYGAFATDDCEVELLTTDAIRRPLNEEPTPGSTATSKPDYTEFSARVRDRMFPEIRDIVEASEPDDVFSGSLSRRLYVRSNAPDHPTNLSYLMAPRFDEWGGVHLQVNVRGADDETEDRLQHIITENSGSLQERGFQVNRDSLLGLVKKELRFDVDAEDIGKEVVEEVASEYAAMIEIVHPLVSRLA